MAMHNVRFPEFVDYGFRSGQGWQTLIQTTASGHETRLQRWPQARLQMIASRTLEPNSEAATAYDFLIARRGAFYAFRAKDWNDYCTDATHRTPANVTGGDQLCENTVTGDAYGDGSTTTFTLRVQYDIAGLNPYPRTNVLPITATVQVEIDGTPTTDFTVNEVTRTLTFGTAPGNGLLVTAGFQFDVPVRISEGMDRAAMISIDAFGLHSRPVELVEVLDETERSESWDPGGSTDGWLGVDGPISLDFHTKMWAMDPANANTAVFLPNPANHPGGADYFELHIKSGAAGSIDVYDDEGNSVGSTLASGNAATISLLHDRTNSTHEWEWVQL